MVVRELRELTEEEFLAIALQKGLVLTPISMYKKEFALSTASRLASRMGEKVYQVAAYDLPLFSRTAAEALFPSSLLDPSSTEKTRTWKATTQFDAVTLLGSMLSEERVPLCAGLSRALKKKSEREIYAIATIVAPVEISIVDRRAKEGRLSPLHELPLRDHHRGGTDPLPQGRESPRDCLLGGPGGSDAHDGAQQRRADGRVGLSSRTRSRRFKRCSRLVGMIHGVQNT